MFIAVRSTRELASECHIHSVNLLHVCESAQIKTVCGSSHRTLSALLNYEIPIPQKVSGQYHR